MSSLNLLTAAKNLRNSIETNYDNVNDARAAIEPKLKSIRAELPTKFLDTPLSDLHKPVNALLDQDQNITEEEKFFSFIDSLAQYPSSQKALKDMNELPSMTRTEYLTKLQNKVKELMPDLENSMIDKKVLEVLVSSLNLNASEFGSPELKSMLDQLTEAQELDTELIDEFNTNDSITMQIPASAGEFITITKLSPAEKQLVRAAYTGDVELYREAVAKGASKDKDFAMQKLVRLDYSTNTTSTIEIPLTVFTIAQLKGH